MRQELCVNCQSINVVRFKLCWACGTPPYRGPPVHRNTPARPVRIDRAKLRASRDDVLAGSAVRPGRQRNCTRADEIDAVIRASSSGLRASSSGLRDWDSGTDEDVFAWCCFLYAHVKRTTWVHDVSCPNVGSNAAANSPAIANCVKWYAADSLDKGVKCLS